MLVKERMSPRPVTVQPDTSLLEALQIMREHRVRRLPVLTKAGKLVGIVLEKDLLYASPSPATSLSIYEMNYLIAKIKIRDLMTQQIITVSEDCSLEEAARVMVDNEISGLPVMADGQLVGIITESDLFKVFLELLGAREQGLRVTVRVLDRKGVLARLTGAISARGANIVALGTFGCGDSDHCALVIKVQEIEREEIEVIEPAIQGAQAEGLDAQGPYPADTVFMRAVRGDFDMVVPMYHDQGLIPIKLTGFGQGVNVTLGLPIIRTSVDHGTAFGKAWQFRADEGSLVMALELAVRMARTKHDQGGEP